MDEYDVHERDKFGKTILHYYIETMKDLSIDFREVFEELFKRGLDVDEKQLKGPFKRSYLHMAVNQNKIELFNYLLSKDPDVNSVDANGNNIISTAVINYNKNPESFGHYINELLKRKADPDQKNNYGNSAKKTATNVGNSDVGKFFQDS